MARQRVGRGAERPRLAQPLRCRSVHRRPVDRARRATGRDRGVMQANFAFPWEDVDIWRPMEWNVEDSGQPFFRRAHWLRAIGRLRPDVTADAARLQLATVAARLRDEYPATNATLGAGLTPLHEFLVGDTRRPLLMLLGAV